MESKSFERYTATEVPNRTIITHVPGIGWSLVGNSQLHELEDPGSDECTTVLIFGNDKLKTPVFSFMSNVGTDSELLDLEVSL